MSANSNSGFAVKLTGPGLSFDRSISEETANRIINLIMGGAGSLPPLPAGTVGAGGTGAAGLSPQNPTELAGMSIKQFVASKRPENLYQRVACLAYYLTYSMGTPHFKTKDISKANTDAAASKFSNAAVFVTHATNRYGYLSAAGGGNKQISAFGEQIVDALPDREAVKKLQDDYKSRGRRKSSKKPRKKSK